MSKKKSYMNKENILSEGFFDTLKKMFTKYPKLKRDKKFTNALKDLNKGQQKLQDLMNDRIKKFELDMKPVKLNKFKTSDFFK